MKKVVVDCTTGHVSVEDLTAKEETQRAKDTTEHEKRQAAEQADEASRDAVLDKVAKAAGVTVEELRKALR